MKILCETYRSTFFGAKHLRKKKKTFLEISNNLKKLTFIFTCHVLLIQVKINNIVFLSKLLDIAENLS